MNKPSKIDVNGIGIASPCNMSWAEMKGDDRVRHCASCKLNVFNVSQLSKAEAEALIEKSLTGERVCVRLMRRHDGTLITKDCPTGKTLALRRRYKITAAVASIFSLVFAFVGHKAAAEDTQPMGEISIEPPGGMTYVPAKPKPVKQVEMMGKIALPQPVKPVQPKSTPPPKPPTK